MRIATDRRAFYPDLASGAINALVDLPGDFSEHIARGDSAAVELVTDGSDPNTASLASGYIQGAWQSWLDQRALGLGVKPPPGIDVAPRVWFNPELESRRFLVPGSIALIQMMIGSLLTALVVAREWERGTIEALLATPVGIVEFMIGKLVPNFLLGLIAMTRLCDRGAVSVSHSAAWLVAAALCLHRDLPQRRAGDRPVDFHHSPRAIPGEPDRDAGRFHAGPVLFRLHLRIVEHAGPAAMVFAHRAGPLLRAGPADMFLAGNLGSVLIPCSLALLLMSALLFFRTALATRTRLD